MGAHLTDESLLELLERGGKAAGHAASCVDCQRRLEQAGAGLALARDADVPEPSPAYWETFRRQVDRRLQAASASPQRPRLVAALALAASVLLAVAAIVFNAAQAPRQPAAAKAAVLPAWSALPDPDVDPGWDALRALAPSGGLQAAVECRLAECLAELSEDESRALVEVLRSELGTEGKS